MEFLLLFDERKSTPPPEEEGLAAMKKYSASSGAGAFSGAAGRWLPRPPAAGVRVRDGKAFVTDGPFPETKELVAGFWIVDVADRDGGARDRPRVALMRSAGPIELHALKDRCTFPDSEDGTPFLLAFRVEPGLSDPDGAKLREMIAFAQALEPREHSSRSRHSATSRRRARIEAKAEQMFVTDGPSRRRRSSGRLQPRARRGAQRRSSSPNAIRMRAGGGSRSARCSSSIPCEAGGVHPSSLGSD